MKKYQNQVVVRRVRPALKYLFLCSLIATGGVFGYTYLDNTQLAIATDNTPAPQARISDPIPLLSISTPTNAQPRNVVAIEATSTSEVLSELLNDFAESHDADLGIHVQSLSESDFNASYEPGQVFNAASLYKTLAAYRALQLVDEGTLSLEMKVSKEETLESCIYAAITVSDNPCGVILQKLSRATELTSLAQDWGMVDTDMTGYYPQTSAADQALLYQRIYEGIGLSEESHTLLMDLLADQKILDRVPSYADATLYHKTGDVNGTVNSASIISGSTDTYIVTILSNKWDVHYQDKYKIISALHEEIHEVITNE